MADEELNEKDQKDWQAATDATDASSETKDAKDDGFAVDMDQVEAVLNATVDKSSMTPQMRRMMARQEENTKRVEETIKGTKSNPRWFVPLFCVLMVIGLVWVVCYYLTSNYPIPNIGAWNLLIGFVIIMIGFLMTMWWR
ncbi:cell division protein CrgA [Bifidobacterium aesculapii]|uniref:cell division protein CrgA n=1 Tax=Bifidobacterium aesculapii TaxID=1329411 RepID=UPI0006E468FC|nr:cell division protein CrgA [Bifidobacterium aesculapii]